MEKNKTKIIFVTNFCTHYVIKLFELLAREYNIEFLFTGGQENYWDKKNKTWTGNFKARYLNGFFVFPQFKITPYLFGLFYKDFDIIIKTIDDRFALPFVFFVSKLKKKPFILWTGVWCHPQTLIHKLTFGLTKFIYNHSDAIITYGEHVKNYLINLRIKENKIFCAPHSINNSLFNKSVSEEEKNKLKKDLSLADGQIILYVGRLEQCKGLNYLIEAVSNIELDNIYLLFVGSGKQKNALEEKCKKLFVKYRFLDHIPNNELYRYYAITDVFVLPSVSTKNFKEPWGVVINEAMNQGCPVIATESVGAAMAGLVENGKNGFVIPERNVQALKESIETILKNKDLRNKMSVNSKEIIKDWTINKTIDGFMRSIEYVNRLKTIYKKEEINECRKSCL